MFQWSLLRASIRGVGGGVGDPEMNKFEQLSSDDHLMSVVAGSILGPLSGVCTLPCVLSHDACDVAFTPSLVDRMTETRENITFPQLLLRIIKTKKTDS